MYLLNRIAQNIVETLSKIIEYPISIINKDGIIIGSTDKERIGVIHKPEIIDIKEDTDMSVMPGVTAPIIINNSQIGTLGIIGEKEEVEKYLYLVKNHVEIMCQDALREEMDTLESKMIQNFVQQLIHLRPGDVDDMKLSEQISLLGYDIDINRLCVIIELFPNNELIYNLKNNEVMVTSLYFQKDVLDFLNYIFGNSKQIIKTFISVEQILVILPMKTDDEYNLLVKKLKQKLNKLNEFLKTKFDLIGAISVGEIEKGIYGITSSYLKAKSAMLSKKDLVNYDNNIFFYSSRQSTFQSLNYGVTNDYKKRLIKLIAPLIEQSNYNLLAESFLHYCYSDLNVSATARNMYVHRNTVLYRLEKIQELTGVNITSFTDCLILYLAIISYDQSNNEI